MPYVSLKKSSPIKSGKASHQKYEKKELEDPK